MIVCKIKMTVICMDTRKDRENRSRMTSAPNFKQSGIRNLKTRKNTRLPVGFVISSSLFIFPYHPTHFHKREGDGKRNILLGWPKKSTSKNKKRRGSRIIPEF